MSQLNDREPAADAPPPGFPAEAFATRMGVHYPKGFAVIALADGDTLEHFKQALAQAGFGPDHLITVPAGTMAEFLDRTLRHAGMLAQIIASEMKQSQIFLQLAQQRAHFLLVRIEDDAARDRLIEIGGRHGSHKAVYYQALAIEELAFSSEHFPGPSPYGVNERPKTNAMRAPK